MSTTTNRKRRNENRDKVDDDDDVECIIENCDDRMNLGNDNDTDDNDSDGKDLSVIEDNMCVKSNNDDDEVKGANSKDEEYDIHNDKKKESNDLMINYAKRFTELVNRNESLETILQFIENHPVAAQQRDSRGEYPLHVACRFKPDGNDDRIIIKLIELYKIAVTIRNRDRYYPAESACMYNQSENSIMKLIEIFPDAANNSLTWRGSSALYWACRFTKSDKVIRHLIDLNPTALQQKDMHGGHPIHTAIDEKQSNEVIEHILNVDPLSIQRQNANGQSPLHMKYPDRLNVIFMECMKSLSNIPINMRDNNGKTPLHNACNLGKDDVVEFLLKCPGIDVNANININIHREIDINAEESSNSSNTPLHEASCKRHTNIVRQLLGHPCIRLDEKDEYNITPLDWTKCRIKQQIKLLKDNRTDDNEDNMKQKLSEELEVEKLLEDFPIQRRWQAFVYLLGNGIEL